MRITFRSRLQPDSLRAPFEKRPHSGAASEAMCLNELTPLQRERVLQCVREGMSLREVERVTGHRRETVSRYARTAGLETKTKRSKPQGGRARASRDRP